MKIKNIMLVLTLLPIFLLTASCNKEKVAIYSYNGITLKRIDTQNYTKFYTYDNQHGFSQSSCLSIYYHGQDGFIDGYLLFNKDKTIEVMPVAGYYKVNNSECKIRVLKFDNPSFIKWRDSIKNNYNGIIRILSIEDEQNKLNSQNKSLVVVRDQ